MTDITDGDLNYDELITDKNHPDYDWADDPTLTSEELLEKFHAIGAPVEIIGPEEWATQQAQPRTLHEILTWLGVDKNLAAAIGERAGERELMSYAEARDILGKNYWQATQTWATSRRSQK